MGDLSKRRSVSSSIAKWVSQLRMLHHIDVIDVIGYIPVRSQCHVPMTSKRGIPKDVIKTSHVTSYCDIFITSFLRHCRTSYCDIFIMLFSYHCRTSYCGIFIMSFLHHSGTCHYDMMTYQ